jgi:hypothetical protein
MFPLSELQFSGTDAPTRWGAIAVGVMTLLYIAFIRPLRNAKKKDPMERAAHGGAGGSSLAQQRAIEREMSNLLVEYEQMIRRMTAGLDTRSAKLELLIREAEGMIGALKSATATAAAGGPTGAAVSPDLPALPSPAEPLSEPRSVAKADVPLGPDPRYAEVYHLADGGQAPREIARRLGRPHGEIELILALRADAR